MGLFALELNLRDGRWAEDLGGSGPFLLAILLALVGAAALRRIFAKLPGARAAWLLPLAVAWTLGGRAVELSEADSEAPGEAMRTEEAAQEAARWEARSRPGSEALLSAESWSELASLLAREGPARVALAGDDALYVPPHWRLPPGARVGAEGESTVRQPLVVWCLEHDAVVDIARTNTATARLAEPSSERALLRLEARSAEGNGEGGAAQWEACAEARVDAGALRTDLEWTPQESGVLDLRLVDEEGRELGARSRLLVRPAPKVSWRGERLEALRAALSAQGYDVAETASLEPSEACDVLLLGKSARLADGDLERLREGGGLWVASPEAWEALQEREDADTWLPARVQPEAEEEPEEGEENPSDPEGGSDEPPPDDVPPQEEETEAGSFALLVVLDLSGSFAEPLRLAWTQVAGAFQESEAFELQGVIGFNKEVFPLLPLGAHGERLEALLENQRTKLDQYVRRGGRSTLFAPALVRVAQEWDRVKPDAMLVVVISDGIFSDPRKDQWRRQVEAELVGKRGVVISTIHIVAQGTLPEFVHTGLLNLDEIALHAGTSKATRRSTLGSALRLVPVVARQVGEAAGWTPPSGGGEGEENTVPPDAPETTNPEEREPEVTPPTPLVPRPGGLHPAEGARGELDQAPWAPLTSLRDVRLKSWAATAWPVDPKGAPMLVTGAVGAGRLALLAASPDDENWPGAHEDERFPLWAARIADYLRRREAPPNRIACRVADGASLASSRNGEAEVREVLEGLFDAAELEEVWGSWRRSEGGRVESTLRVGGAPTRLQGERPWIDWLREDAAVVSVADEASQGKDSAFQRGRRQRRLAAFGSLIGLVVLLEALFGLWARSRREAH